MINLRVVKIKIHRFSNHETTQSKINQYKWLKFLHNNVHCYEEKGYLIFNEYKYLITHTYHSLSFFFPSPFFFCFQTRFTMIKINKIFQFLFLWFPIFLTETSCCFIALKKLTGLNLLACLSSGRNQQRPKKICIK